MLTRVVGGRALIRSEPYGKDDAYGFMERLVYFRHHAGGDTDLHRH